MCCDLKFVYGGIHILERSRNFKRCRLYYMLSNCFFKTTRPSMRDKAVL